VALSTSTVGGDETGSGLGSASSSSAAYRAYDDSGVVSGDGVRITSTLMSCGVPISDPSPAASCPPPPLADDIC
jgi:hypothetical protein